MNSSLWSLLWWIAIGAAFFWMMSRGGCGMGHGHGRQHDRPDGRGTSRKPVDPVCRMEVDPARAAGTRVADGETVFFCSQTCIDAFDRQPAMYAHRPQQDDSRHRHAGC